MSARRLVLDALLIAMMIAVTSFIAIPIGVYGYINLSDSLIMIFSEIVPLGDVFVVSALGCALSDLFLGYGHYALFTFLIKGTEAIIIYKLNHERRHREVGYLAGAVFMIFGYGFSDVILSGNIGMFIPSAIANLPQAVLSFVIGAVLYRTLGRLFVRLDYGSETH